MNTVVWVLQILLAVVFAAAGVTKLLRPREQLVSALGSWVEEFPAPLLKLLGALEILAAAGLVLPYWTGIAEVLTPLAALGIVVVMAGATVTHARHSEHAKSVLNVALLALAAVVAWARFGS